MGGARSPGPPASFRTATLLDVGGREVNEDYCGHALQGGTGCWMVADGLGGHRAGEVASRLAVERVLASFAGDPAVSADALRHHFAAAERHLLERQAADPRVEGMRTTAVVLVAGAGAALWAHAGDSRLYHFRSGRIVAQTRDHSVPQLLLAAGQITPDQVRHHLDRNRVLRALGGGESRPTVEAEPRELAPGDAFLLCTDGLWEHVLESEMETLLPASAAPAEWLAALGARAAEAAPPGRDNYCGLAVFVDAPGEPA